MRKRLELAEGLVETLTKNFEDQIVALEALAIKEAVRRPR